MSEVASVNLIVIFGILAGVLLCIPTGVKAQQDNSNFLIKPQSNNISICNCSGNEEATLIFHCAVKDADRIVWMINETSVDKNKYPYGVSSYKDVTYSSFTYNISGDSDEIMVQCQIQRGSILITSEAATISVISCSCPATGTEQSESEDTTAGTKISNNTSAAGGYSYQPTNDCKSYIILSVMGISLVVNVVLFSVLFASICYYKRRNGGTCTSRVSRICSDGGNVNTTKQDNDTETDGVARPRVRTDNSDVITTQGKGSVRKRLINN